jgi:hypothetical protein
MPYLYLLASRRLWFRYKIGITRNMGQRFKDIRRSEPFLPLLVVPLFFAPSYETWLKKRFKRHRANDMRGSGRTEWFKFIFPLRFIFWLLVFAAIEWSVIFLILLLIWL